MKYTLIFTDGATPMDARQASNFRVDTGAFEGPDVRHCATLADARDQFALMCQQRGRDHVATADGGPSADVYLSPVEPNDYPIKMLTLSAHGRVRQAAA